jgi:hypothetical protein
MVQTVMNLNLQTETPFRLIQPPVKCLNTNLCVAAIYSIMLDCKLLVEQLGSANVSHLGDLILQLITLLHCKKLSDLKLG